METSVPIKLLQAVDALGWTKRMRAHMLKLIGSALYRYEVDDATSDEYYLRWSAKYILKMTSDDFYRLFNRHFGIRGVIPMHDRILQHDSLFLTNKGKSLYYRLNPQLLLGETETMDIQLDVEETSLNHLFPDIISHYKELCSSLEMNESTLLHNMEFLISPVMTQVDDIWVISKDKHEAGSLTSQALANRQFKKVSYEQRQQYFNGKKNLRYLRVIRDSKDHQGSDLVLKENQAFIGNKEVFLDKVVQQTREVAKKRVFAASSSERYCLVGSTNGRFNTYLTNLNTAFLPFISIDGKMIESWDLRSSQPTILANLLTGDSRFLESLRNSPFAKLKEYLNSVSHHINAGIWSPFLHSLIEEDIYSDLAKELNLSRGQAKHFMMVALFRKDFDYTDIHRALENRFPGTGSGLIELKRSLKSAFPNEKSPIALFLQMVEAHIFIAGILRRFAETSLPVFSRHDSILFPSTQENHFKVFREMNEHFDSIGFRGKLQSLTYWVHPHFDPPYLVDKDFLYSQEEYWSWDAEEAEKQKEFERRFREAHGIPA